MIPVGLIHKAGLQRPACGPDNRSEETEAVSTKQASAKCQACWRRTTLPAPALNCVHGHLCLTTGTSTICSTSCTTGTDTWRRCVRKRPSSLNREAREQVHHKARWTNYGPSCVACKPELLMGSLGLGIVVFGLLLHDLLHRNLLHDDLSKAASKTKTGGQEL